MTIKEQLDRLGYKVYSLKKELSPFFQKMVEDVAIELAKHIIREHLYESIAVEVTTNH